MWRTSRLCRGARLIWRRACQGSRVHRPVVEAGARSLAGEAPGALATVRQSDMRGLATPRPCSSPPACAFLKTGVASLGAAHRRISRAGRPVARRLAREGGWLCGLRGHRGRPEEAGERAGERDGDDVRRLAPLAEQSVEAVEAVLAAPGDLQHLGRLALVAGGERGADPRSAAVLPGGLDQQPARVAGACLGDRALAAALAGLLERGHQPEPAGELARGAEAAEVA